MLSDAERVGARRYCGYPAYGAQGPGSGWYFFQAYGVLEYRLQNLSDAEESVLRGYLATLDGLEMAVPASGEGLEVAEAATFRRNPDELGERLRLLDEWRRRLCGFLGVPPGPALRRRGECVI